MDLGIVIVNWNVRDLLAACLDSVYVDLAQSQLRAAVVVVDNGSRDGSAEMVRRQFPRTMLIEAENRGMGAGNNLGLRYLVQKHAPLALLVLNPDTRLLPGALRTLVSFIRQHPRAGAAAPALVNPDGSLQHSGFHFPGLTQAALDLFPPPGRLARLMDSPINGRYPAGWYARGAPFRVDHTLGAAFAVRLETLAECGLFDESFDLYCEEIDWQWRMAQAGWERWVAPAARVVHYGGQSTGQIRLASYVRLWLSRRRLYQRYHSRPLNAVLAQLVTLSLRGQIRDNFRRSARGELSPEARAETNTALSGLIAAWQRPSRR